MMGAVICYFLPRSKARGRGRGFLVQSLRRSSLRQRVVMCIVRRACGTGVDVIWCFFQIYFLLSRWVYE